VAVDGSGNVYIADEGNNRVRKVDTNGVIRTVAGDGTGDYSGDGGAATNASLNSPSGVAVDTTGNVFIADFLNNRVREVHFAGLPTLSLPNVSAVNAGDYQVVITNPYGSVTSAVATLTVIVPPAIAMKPPIIAENNLILGFTVTQGSSPSFTLLRSPSVTGPWTTNTSAVLTTNAQSGSYEFTMPVPGSTAFFRVRLP
jgi:hypothetical protein